MAHNSGDEVSQAARRLLYFVPAVRTHGTTLRAVLVASGSQLLGNAWSELWVIDKPDVRGRPLAGSSQDPPRTHEGLGSNLSLTSCSVHLFFPVRNVVSGRLQKMKTCN